MRHVVLIHAHRSPEQFGRLCRALEHPDFDIYANIDIKSDIVPFVQAAPQATFIRKRIDIKWGKWSQVEATLNSLAEIAASGKTYGHVIFISGQDYPVVPMECISRFLSENGGHDFIDITFPVPAPIRKKQVERYTKRWYLNGHSVLFSMLVSKTLLRLLPDRKKPYEIYQGSMWWNLSGESVAYLLDFCAANPQIVRSYRQSLCSDEMFFQSTLMASPLKDKIVNKNFRYIDWSAGGANPKYLTAADFAAITGSGAWFARKIDADSDGGLLDMLDRHRQESSNAQ